MTASKVCSKCGGTFPLTEFHKSVSMRDGRRNECKTCYHLDLSVKYALRRGFADLKPAACECCGKVTDKLNIDHDHNSKMFRGFLCTSCNKTIGCMGDNLQSVTEAGAHRMFIDYMRRGNLRMGFTYGGTGKRQGR